jgi:hypothetical protein
MLSARLSLCLVLLAASAAAADFDLEGGAVHFAAPGDWPVIMQMTEGNPQVVAFQVKDPAAEGTEESSRVTVTARKLADGAAFQEMVNGALEKARQQTGYEQDQAGGDSSTLRYFATEGKARYHYREQFYFKHGAGVILRCARPVLDKTSPAWTAAFEKGCDGIAASLAQ